MILRDTFALEAMKAILVSCQWEASKMLDCESVASDAYAIADAMMKERGCSHDRHATTGGA